MESPRQNCPVAKEGNASLLDQPRTGSVGDPKMARPEAWTEDKQGIPGGGLASRNRQRMELRWSKMRSLERESFWNVGDRRCRGEACVSQTEHSLALGS